MGLRADRASETQIQGGGSECLGCTDIIPTLSGSILTSLGGEACYWLHNTQVLFFSS